jgi:hypothetical protein
MPRSPKLRRDRTDEEERVEIACGFSHVIARQVSTISLRAPFSAGPAAVSAPVERSAERKLVEHFFNVLKQFRGIFLAGIHLACALAWLR